MNLTFQRDSVGSPFFHKCTCESSRCGHSSVIETLLEHATFGYMLSLGVQSWSDLILSGLQFGIGLLTN